MGFREIERLDDFFGTYFHEDWDIYGTGWNEVVSHYVSENSTADILEIANGLKHLARSLPCDDHDAYELISSFGNYYHYPNDGLSAQQWVQDLAAYLANEAKRTEDL